MTDLEMTRLCAEVMGIEYERDSLDRVFLLGTYNDNSPHTRLLELYNPLHDDAQAMALVKKFKVGVEYYQDKWIVYPTTGLAASLFGVGQDLNRAIVECVSKMQAAKK